MNRHLWSRLSNCWQWGKFALALLTMGVLVACSQQSDGDNFAQTTSTAPLSSPTASTDEEIPAGYENIAITFFKSWEAGDYESMYALLTPQSQALVDSGSFTARYQESLAAAHVSQIRTQPIAARQAGARAEMTMRVIWESPIVGEISREHLINLAYEGERWGIVWQEGLILPELADGANLVMDYRTPARANIYDVNGVALAYQGTAIALGVVPGLIEDEPGMLNALSVALGKSAADIQAAYEFALPEWYVPIGEISSDAMLTHIDLLQPYFGVGLVTNERLSRIYPEGTVAPHLIGYVTNVPADNYDYYFEQGYQATDRVGRVGIEAWGEKYLAGRRGGVLSALDANGNIAATVQRQEPNQSRAVYATFDKTFQRQVEEALAAGVTVMSARQAGAAVVLEVNSGRILAMATYPTYDAAIFDPKRPNFEEGLSRILNDPSRPLVNRATQGVYPAGSVFKIVTLSAGLLSGQYGFESRYTSNGYWDRIGENFVKRDWNWEAGGHGNISYKQALVESCNSCFYDMAFELNNVDSFFLPNIARGFGLGAATGLAGLPNSGEDAGIIPDPEWKINNVGGGWVPGDAVNMGIGQGYVLVTPLQIANIMAALANGGALYQPTLIDRIGEGGGAPEERIPSQVIGQLPIGDGQLQGIREALYQVTTARKGTATDKFESLIVPVAGKTGTAENPSGQDHAWFAAYAPAIPFTLPDGTPINEPEIAIAVIAENAGEGSAVAAPITRRIIELYYGLPITPYPWEG